MNRKTKDSRLVAHWAPRMEGVFSLNDLKALFDEDDLVALKRRVDRLADAAEIQRFCRGFYTAPGFNPEVLAARLNPRSYISLGTILARALLIGAVPEKALYSVKTGRARSYEGPNLVLVYLGIAPHLYFGFENERGVQTATPEKALLDTLYFHTRGHAFSFDLFSDIDLSRIRREVIESYLARYRNPRFVRFVEGYLRDRA